MNRRDADYIAWCDAGAAIFSTCTRAHYMAIILDRHGRVVGTGYNGGPPGYAHCSEGGCPHANDEPGAYEHRCIAIHAEENALLWSDHQARVGGTLYVNGSPCYSCAKKIAGSGVQRVVYVERQAHDGHDEGVALMRECGLLVQRL